MKKFFVLKHGLHALNLRWYDSLEELNKIYPEEFTMEDMGRVFDLGKGYLGIIDYVE